MVKEPVCRCRRHKRLGLPSLGRDDPPGKEMATCSGILGQRIPWSEEPGGYSPQGHKESGTTEVT